MIFKRPWVLFILVISVLAFSLISFVRFGMALSLWEFLSSLPAAVHPAYLAAVGLVWGGFGIVTAFWLWQGRSKGKAAVRILAVTYALYYWIDQVFIGASGIRSANWFFSGIVAALLVVLVFVSLALPAVVNFFGEDDEQEE